LSCHCRIDIADATLFIAAMLILIAAAFHYAEADADDGCFR